MAEKHSTQTQQIQPRMLRGYTDAHEMGYEGGLTQEASERQGVAHTVRCRPCVRPIPSSTSMLGTRRVGAQRRPSTSVKPTEAIGLDHGCNGLPGYRRHKEANNTMHLGKADPS